MKKKITRFKSLLKVATTPFSTAQPSSNQYNGIVAFEEKERPMDGAAKQGMCAVSLFSAFTADIMNENKLFTR
jgi:hypothetical protein